MLRLAVIFLVIALVAALFGFGAAANLISAKKTLFWCVVAAVLCAASLWHHHLLQQRAALASTGGRYNHGDLVARPLGARTICDCY